MSTTLYDISVASYLQTLGGVSNTLKKGLDFCTEHKIDPAVLLETRLYPNMQPFRFQIIQVCHHSMGAIDALRSGTFTPNFGTALGYKELQSLVEETINKLRGLTPDDVNGLEANAVTFILNDLKLPFNAANFILSFSLPNFYFHATTAHDILRSIGVSIGKRHYMGMLRLS